MIAKFNIHSILENELKNKSINMSQLNKITGINRGTLSQIFNNKPQQLPSIAQLDKITAALNHQAGYFYDLYIESYFDQSTPHWKRLKPLLYQCVKLGLIIQIERILELLMEDLSHTRTIFALAEEWHSDGYIQELLPFYECIIKNEKFRHAEHVAISHYRIFRLSLSEDDFEANLRAAIRFEPYRNEMPIDYCLNSLFKLTNIYFSMHEWEKSMLYADEMRVLSNYVYECKLHLKKSDLENETFLLDRHLVTYYGHSYLMIGVCLEEQKKYQESLNYVQKYENLEWFEGLNEDGQNEVNKLKIFAKANFLSLNILLGNQSYLNKYTNFLEKNPSEILPGLMTILQSANKYEFEVNYIIDKFYYIFDYNGEDELIIDSYYSVLNTLDRYEILYRQMAIYYFRNGNYTEGIQYISKCLAVSNRINKKSDFAEYPELLNLLKEWSLLLSEKKET